MPNRPSFIDEQRRVYPTRVAGSLVVSLLVMIAAFRFWPTPSSADEERIFDARAQETIQAEEILPTSQNRRRPPPPAPMLPVVVPDDVILSDPEIELTDNLVTAEPGNEDGDETGPDVATSGSAARPDSGPRPVRFAEPEYTREARRRKVRAEVIVEVLVDELGRVETARVVDRFLLDGRDSSDREQVTSIGYGVEDAALAAAEQCLFRPARQDGKAVRSFTTLTFSFGV